MGIRGREPTGKSQRFRFPQEYLSGPHGIHKNTQRAYFGPPATGHFSGVSLAGSCADPESFVSGGPTLTGLFCLSIG